MGWPTPISSAFVNVVGWSPLSFILTGFPTAGHASPPRNTTAQLIPALTLGQTSFRAPCLDARELTPGLCYCDLISMLTAIVVHDVNLSNTNFRLL
jgi:hypothetical protein